MQKIEKGIPIPPKKRGRGSHYMSSSRFFRMEIGDSFFETPASSAESVAELQGRLASGAANWSRANGGVRKFKSRTVTEKTADNRSVTGVRVWRAEDRDTGQSI